MSRIIICLCLLFSLWSCSSSEEVLKRYQGVSIAVGTAGGFTGVTQGFTIGTNGSAAAFLGRLDKRKEQVRFQIEKSTVVDFYTQLEQMKFSELSYNGNGNLNCFVELRTDTLKHRIRWAPGDTLAPIEVRRFYDGVMKYMQEHAPRPDSLGDAQN